MIRLDTLVLMQVVSHLTFRPIVYDEITKEGVEKHQNPGCCLPQCKRERGSVVAVNVDPILRQGLLKPLAPPTTSKSAKKSSQKLATI